MGQRHRRYVAAEAVVGAAFSGVLSVVFAFLVFGGATRVPFGGAGGLIVDAVPQSFMIAFMATLIPTLLTRRRLARGAVTPRRSATRLPRPALVRALLLGVTCAGIGAALTALIAAAATTGAAFGAVVVGKSVYGAALGALVAAIAADAALDPSR